MNDLLTPPAGILTDEDAAWMQQNLATVPPEREALVKAKLNEYQVFRAQHPKPLNQDEAKQYLDQESSVLSLYETPDKADFGPMVKSLPSSEQGKVKARVSNEYFLGHITGKPRSLYADTLSYASERGRIAGQLFDGRGADSDEGFAKEAGQYLTKRRDFRVQSDSFASAGAAAALKLEPGDMVTDLAKIKETSGNIETYTPEEADKFTTTYRVARSRIEDIAGPLRPVAREIYGMLSKGKQERFGEESQAAIETAIDKLAELPEDQRGFVVAMLKAKSGGDGTGNTVEKATSAAIRGLTGQLRGFASNVERTEILKLQSRLAGNESLATGGTVQVREDGDLEKSFQTLTGNQPTQTEAVLKFRDATPEERAKLAKMANKALTRSDVAAQAIGILEGTIDPIKTKGLVQKVAVNVGSSLGAMVPIAIPYAGVVLAQGGYADAEYQRQRAMGTDPATAHKAAQITGTVQAGLERMAFLFSFVPGSTLGKLTPKFTTPGLATSYLAQTGAKMAAVQGAEYTEEIAQDAAPMFTAALGGKLGWTLPEQAQFNAELKNWKVWNPETFLTVAALSMVGGGFQGVAQTAEARATLTAQLADPINAQAIGIPAETAAKIAALPEGERLDAYKAAWSSRDASTPAAAEAQQQLATRTAEAVKQGREEVTTMQAEGITIQRTNEGWNVVDDTDGTAIPHATAEEAMATARSVMTERGIQREETFLNALDEFTGMMTPGRTIQLSEKSGTLLQELEDASTAGRENTVQAIWDRADEYRASKGQAALERDKENPDSRDALEGLMVLGRSSTEAQGNAARSISLIMREGRTLDLVEEQAENDLREAVASGKTSMETMNGIIDRIEAATGDKYRFKEGDVGTTEAWSRLVRLYTTGTRKGNKITAGARAEMASDFRAERQRLRKAEAQGIAPAAFAKMREYLDHLKSIMGQVSRLMKAKAEGKLDDLEAMIRESVGLKEQDAHEAAVVEAVPKEYPTDPMTGEGAQSYSIKERDTEYMAAVEAGDVAKQQEMVDAAAKAADYTVGPVYHSTSADFTRFEQSMDIGFHFGTEEQARYKSQNKRIIRAVLRPQGTVFMKDHSWQDVKTFIDVASKIVDISSQSKRLVAEWETLGKIRKQNDLGELPADEARAIFAQRERAWRDKSKAAFASMRQDFLDYGINSIKYENEVEGKGLSWIILDQVSMKNAEPITRDESGNVIPLSERFNPAKDSISYSIKARDTEYMAAVEAGDVEKQQELVDDAAKAAGLKLVEPNGYTDPDYLEPVNEIYSGREKHVAAMAREFAKSGKWNGRPILKIGDRALTGSHRIYAARRANEILRRAGREEIEIPTYELSDDDAEAFDQWIQEDGADETNAIDYASFHTSAGDDTDKADTAKAALAAGVIPFEFEAILRAEEMSNWGNGFEQFKGQIYASISQIKSAEPITRDESGNVIPLSERFNPAKDSISYSIASSSLSVKPPAGVKAIETDSLPIWDIPKDKDSLPKLLSTPAHREKFFARLDKALEYLKEDPIRITTADGWVKFLQMAGVSGQVTMPPSGLAEIISDPAAYIAKLKGGYHGKRTLPGSQESAKQGLDGTREMRRLIGEGKAPAMWSVALHHMWGILSRMLPPLQQEGMWLRLIAHRPVLNAIQSSIDGKFALTQDEWAQLVQDARAASVEGAGQVGNAATANANSFHMMLNRLNGRWQDVADVYAEPDSRQMGRKFWALDAGALGIKNKVQRFIGLTFGVPGVIMDRWKFVEFWLPTAMEGMGAATPADFFKYGQNTPSDPTGIYGVYGGVDSSNEVFSLAMYEAFETVLDAAIEKSPELQKHLGPNANPGGMHWHGWNAIKNEAVGHSSLNLTKDLQTAFGVAITAADVYNTLQNGTYFTEGAENQRSNLKFILERGTVRTERTSIPSGLQPGSAGTERPGTGGGDGKIGRGSKGTKGSYSITTADRLTRVADTLASKARDPEVKFKMFDRAQSQLRSISRDIGFRDDVATAAEESASAGTVARHANAMAQTVDRFSAATQARETAHAEAVTAMEAAHEEALHNLSVQSDIETGGAQADGWTADQKDALKVRQRLALTTLQAKQKAEATALEIKQRRENDTAATKERQAIKDLKETQAAEVKDRAKVTGAQAQRRDMLRWLAALDTILMPFPAEVRGKVGGFVKLAGLRTNEQMEAYLKERIGKLDKVLETHMRKEYTEAMHRLLKKAEPTKGKPGEKMAGKLGADVQHLMDRVKMALALSADEVNAHNAALQTKIDSGNLTPEQEALALREIELVQLVGDWQHSDSAKRSAALKAATETYEGGYLAWKNKLIAKRERRAAIKDSLITDTGKAGTPTERKARAEKDLGWKGKLKDFALSLSSFEEVVHYVFGAASKEGRALVDAEREAAYAYEDARDAMADAVLEHFRSLSKGSHLAGEKLRFRLSQLTIDAGGLKLSELEAIQALLLWNQEDGKRHMIGHLDENNQPVGEWHYDQAWVDNVAAQMTPEGKATMVFIQRHYAQEWAGLNPLYRERHGVNMPRHDNYAPITVAPMQAKAGEMIDPVSGQAMTGSILTPGSLRTRSRSAIAEPMFTDALQVLLGHHAQMEHWKAYYDFAVEAQAVLGARPVSNAVTAAAGKQGKVVLGKWIDLFAQGGTRDAGAALAANQILSTVSARAARMALVGRMGTLIIQATQLAAAQAEMPTGAYLARFGKLMTGNLEWGDALRSDFIQRRISEMPPIVRQAMAGLDSKDPNEIKHAVARLGTLISGADGLFTAGTYAILLDYHRGQAKRQGITGPEAEAYAHAEAVRSTERVAQPTRAATRSLFENSTTSPLGRLGWAFASEARQKMALAVWAASNAKANPARAARVSFLVWGVGGLMAQVIRNAWKDARDDDDEEIFDERNWSLKQLMAGTIAGPLQGIPGLGEALQGVVAKATGTYDPSGNLLSGLGRSIPAAKAIVTGDFIDSPEPVEDVMKDVEAILTAAGMANDTLAATTSIMHVVRDGAAILDGMHDDAAEVADKAKRAKAHAAKEKADAKKAAKEAKK